MVDFAKLKANKGSSLAKLTEKLESMNSNSGGQKDERLFKPGFDKKEGKGYAIVRFLPAKDGEPFVKRISHGFQGAGGWYIENNRVTGGFDDDPVSISNRLYWDKGEAEGNEALKNVSRKRKRKTNIYANVYVVKDTVNPQNEGKVMIYDFGPQIFGFIEKAIKPEFEDETAFDPFDMWTGADFKIKIVGKEIPDSKDPSKKVLVPNYEKSEWASPSEFMAGDDEKKEEIFSKTFDLSEFTKVKTFEELAARFEKVTGERHDALQNGDPADKVVAELEKQSTLEASQEPAKEIKSSEAKTPVEEKPILPEDDSSDDDGDDVLKMFRELAGE